MQTGKNIHSSLSLQPVTTDLEKPMDVEPCNVVAIAKKALSASKEAALLAEDAKLIGADLDGSPSSGLVFFFNYLISLLGTPCVKVDLFVD